MVSPRKYKLSVEEDPNDAGALRKALTNMRVGEPETFGGIFQSETSQRRQYEQFTTHTPRDITANTRVIAVLGITQETAAPDVDGWFLSDFCAFWHLFNGTTVKQHWIHCLDLDDLVKKHERYLHGNPFKARKVVLDVYILAKIQQASHGMEHHKPNQLRPTLKKLVRDECAEAAETGQNVLILMFGHGDRGNKGIWIGAGGSLTNVLQIKHFASALGKLQPKITLLTTHCYSGGWSCSPNLNITTMAAAAEHRKSRSWTASGSTGRVCESVFATALIEKLTVESKANPLRNPDEDPSDIDFTEQQSESFAEFTRTVYENLLQNVDRRGSAHGITFSAQDDAWSMCWSERTGIPLAEFGNRWETLPEWPADITIHLGDPQNRDPHVTEEQRAEFDQLRATGDFDVFSGKRASGQSIPDTVLGKRKAGNLFGGTLRSRTRVVSKLASSYLDSYLGQDDTGDDGALHRRLYRIFEGQVTDYDEIRLAHQALEYRFNHMATADKYLELMGLPRPNDQTCCDYDIRKIEEDVGRVNYGEGMGMLLSRTILFPIPIVEERGRPFYKGQMYLVAAFHHAEISKAEMMEKLDALVSVVDEEVEQQKEVIKQDPEVKSKRQKVYQAFGKALGSMSPTKRRSRGQSLTRKS